MMLRSFGVASLVVSGWAVSAQELVYDFEQSAEFALDSNPSPAVETGGVAVFANTSLVVGRELYVTDGSPAGTQLLADLWPGGGDSDPRELTRLPSGLVLFSALHPSLGRELFATDGTALGTTLLSDISAGASDSDPLVLTQVGARVFFFAETLSSGRELWVSDGTALGTRQVADVQPGSTDVVPEPDELTMVALGANQVMFGVFDTLWELWVSDGTSVGTNRVLVLPSSQLAQPQIMTAFGNRVLFGVSMPFGSPMAWVSDGTVLGTYSLGASLYRPFTIAGSLAYFTGSTATEGTEPWVTDGTVAGTRLLADLVPGAGPSDPQFLGAIGSRMIFVASNGSSRWVYRSDGTTASTVAFSSPAPDFKYDGLSGYVHQGEVWFYNSGFAAGGLTRTDGTLSGTSFVPPTPAAGEFGSVGATLLFAATDNQFGGRELWSSTGNPAQLQQLIDTTPSLNGSSSHVLLGKFQGRAVYSVRVFGGALSVWITDGTTAGTQQLSTHGAVHSQPMAAAATDSFFLFAASDPVMGLEPHITDGTAAGTFTIDLTPGPDGSNVNYAAVEFGGRVYFHAEGPAGRELYVSDGTPAGTGLFLDLEPGPGSSVATALSVQSLGGEPRLLFRASTTVDGSGLWQTDGTVAGTQLLVAGSLGGNPHHQFAQLGQSLVFPWNDGASGVEPWITDGTPNGTRPLADLVPGPAYSYISYFVSVGSRVFFKRYILGFIELWSTDGTVAGTLQHPGDSSPHAEGPIWNVSENTAAFWKAKYGRDELWSVSAPNYVPELLRVFDPRGSLPASYVAWEVGPDRLVFGGYDSNLGYELWSTDGTALGTYPVTDFVWNVAETYAAARVGNRVVFSAAEVGVGRELFSIQVADAGAWIVELFGAGCPGGSGVVPEIGFEGEARVSSPQPFGVRLENAIPNSPTFFLWSSLRAATPISACTLWLGGNVQVANGMTNASGTSLVTITPSPSLAGVRLDAQWLVLDPGGSVFGVASSTGGLEVVIGF